MSVWFKELTVVTESHLKSRWCGRKPGEFFRCYFCGYKFKLGDKFRVQYTNDIKFAGGNPIVCEKCDEGNEKTREKWIEKCKEAREKFWYLYYA